ncbi:ribosomal-processing cysteine protease Prp [Thermaerobacter subterraneus]|uniref:Ribosomal processing cysteine protease Prp n=1 Tax=Thermaerobacter subterraneus DSM 13965 TaxID=867903 RepID=K6QDW5_9FIRM|nr:ribosomal-processing cysteine protease Prp [Thermaerobacter subterraneus]EKP94936.1 putative ribosomal protein [Thermaerobacter subterraneus DSM 13965]
MIRAVFFRDGQGAITRFEITGHAGFADRGDDIVCAAVSALGQAAILGLEEVLHLVPEVELDEEGRLVCQLPGDVPADLQRAAQAILETARIGIQAIASDYDEYVRVEERSTGGR